jgi:hypothetical protein
MFKRAMTPPGHPAKRQKVARSRKRKQPGCFRLAEHTRSIEPLLPPVSEHTPRDTWIAIMHTLLHERDRLQQQRKREVPSYIT